MIYEWKIRKKQKLSKSSCVNYRWWVRIDVQSIYYHFPKKKTFKKFCMIKSWDEMLKSWEIILHTKYIFSPWLHFDARVIILLFLLKSVFFSFCPWSVSLKWNQPFAPPPFKIHKKSWKFNRKWASFRTRLLSLHNRLQCDKYSLLLFPTGCRTNVENIVNIRQTTARTFPMNPLPVQYMRCLEGNSHPLRYACSKPKLENQTTFKRYSEWLQYLLTLYKS